MARIDVAWVGGVGVDRLYASRLVLAEILRRRLGALREERALTYAVQVDYAPERGGPGEWRIQTTVDATRTAEAVETVLEILAEMRASPERYRGEFVLARRKLVEELLTSENSVSARAARLAFTEIHGLDDGFYDQLLERIARLTPAEIHAVLSGEVVPERAVIGVYGPPEAVSAARQAVPAR